MTERRRVPRDLDRRSGWERRKGKPRELPRCAIEWAKAQVAGGRTLTDVAHQLMVDRRTLSRRLTDYEHMLLQELGPIVLRYRCQECYALSLSPRCPHGHIINDQEAA